MIGSEYRKEGKQKTLHWANLMEWCSHVWENIVKLDVKKRLMWYGLTENTNT
jgi:hypothetical protein